MFDPEYIPWPPEDSKELLRLWHAQWEPEIRINSGMVIYDLEKWFDMALVVSPEIHIVRAALVEDEF